MLVNLKLEKAKLIVKIEKLDNLSSVDITSLNLILDDLIAGKVFMQSPIMERKVIEKPKVKKQPRTWGGTYHEKFKEVEAIKEESARIQKELGEKLVIAKDNKETLDKANIELEKAKKLITELKKEVKE